MKMRSNKTRLETRLKKVKEFTKKSFKRVRDNIYNIIMVALMISNRISQIKLLGKTAKFFRDKESFGSKETQSFIPTALYAVASVATTGVVMVCKEQLDAADKAIDEMEAERQRFQEEFEDSIISACKNAPRVSLDDLEETA